MSDRLKLTALYSVATIALGTLGIIIFNFVANDWRLVGNPLDVSAIFGDDEPEVVVDDRLESHTLHFGDSIRSIRIVSSRLHVNVRGTSSSTIDVALSLAGDATDSNRFTKTIAVDANGELSVVAGPSGAPGNASGTIDLTVPSRFILIIDAHEGNVSVVNVAGRSDIRTRSGTVELTGMSGWLHCESDTSMLSLDGCTLDSATLSTGGLAMLTLTQGAFRVAAGRVVAANHFGALDASAQEAISVKLLSDQSPVRLICESGDVHLRVLNGARFAFDVSAPLGTIISNVPFDTLTEENATEHLLRATMNGGGIPAVIRAAKGSVEILLFEADETSINTPNGETSARTSELDWRALHANGFGARRPLEGS
ncbi:MAG: hypothetical protein H7X80_11815 [bacterium]|nr:hypothetical protein [Candidatus Kapabacteria bacterium]